jgi:hypothetical protein
VPASSIAGPLGASASVGTQVSSAVHLLLAGLWAGATLFMAWGVVPLASASDVGVDAADSLAAKYVLLSRASALLLAATGAHLALVDYGVSGLLGGLRGSLVLLMVVLWFVLAALAEVGTSRFRDALDCRKVRTAGRSAAAFYRLAAVVAAVLLVLGGYLVA